MIAEWLAKVIFVDVPRWTGKELYPSAAGGKACRWMISLVRWCLVVGGTPFALWAACAWLPEPWIRGAGQIFDWYVWSWVKKTDFARCTDTCRDLTFSMIVFPVSWVVTLVGMTQFRSIAAEMEEQEKDWLYSPSWVKMAEDTLSSRSYHGYGTPLFDGKCVFFFCFWIYWSVLLAGDLPAFSILTGLTMALGNALASLALATHGYRSRKFETISKWWKMNRPQ